MPFLEKIKGEITVKRIKITDFRNIESKEWCPTSKTNFLMGENATGKSSFLKALKFALSGDIAREDVRDGACSTVVEVELKDGTVFSREVFAVGVDKPSEVRVNGKATTAKKLTEILERYFGIPFDSIVIATAKEVGGLSPTELSSIILPYIPEKLNAIKVRTEASTTLTPNQVDLLCSFFPAFPIEFGLDELETAYDKAFNQRKIAKSELATKTAKAKWDGDVPAMTLADIDKEYKSYLEKEAEDKTSATTIASYNNAIAKKNEIETQIKTLEEEYAKIKVTKPNPMVLKNLQEDKEKATARQVEVKVLLGTLTTNIKTFEATLKNLNTSSCPLCEQLVCTTDKTCVKSDIEAVLESNREAASIQERELKECEESIKKTNSAIAEYTQSETLYNKKLLLSSRIQALRNEIPAIPPKPSAITKRDFSKEKAMLDAKRKEIQMYAASLEAMAELEPLQKKVEDLDVVCSQLSAKGDIRQNITEYYVSIFNDEINNVAQKMRSEYNFSFFANNGLGLKFKTKSMAYPRTYEHLSESEKTIMSFFVLHFLNTLSGFKILLLDDLNHLDKKSFEDLMKVVCSEDIQDYYDSIIFASVTNPDLEAILSSYSVARI